MAGKDLYDFAGKEVCYLLVFTHDGTPYIKFGRTADPLTRMSDHMREIPGSAIFSMHETSQTKRVEDDFRRKMRCKGYLTDLTVRDKRQAEVLKGLGPDEAEQVLCDIIEAGAFSGGENKRMRIEAELRRKELDVELASIKARERETELTSKLREKELKVQLVTAALDKGNAELVTQILGILRDL